jgi:hypothetical protein
MGGRGRGEGRGGPNSVYTCKNNKIFKKLTKKSFLKK